MFVWGVAQRGVPMQVNVVGTVMFLVAIVIVLGGEAQSRRRSRRPGSYGTSVASVGVLDRSATVPTLDREPTKLARPAEPVGRTARSR